MKQVKRRCYARVHSRPAVNAAYFASSARPSFALDLSHRRYDTANDRQGRVKECRVEGKGEKSWPTKSE